MAIALIAIGAIWAALGAWGILGVLLGNPRFAGQEALWVVVGMALFVLPGLVVAGIGMMLRRQKETGDRELRRELASLDDRALLDTITDKHASPDARRAAHLELSRRGANPYR